MKFCASPRNFKMRKVSALAIAVFTRRLAELTGGGMTLNRSLEVLLASTQTPALIPLLSAVKTELENGQSLSQALVQQSGVFPPVYIGMVKAGESAGKLEQALAQLADFLEGEIA